MLLTVRETAKELRTNKDYVYRLIKAGLLKSIKVGTTKIRRESLEEFLKEYEGTDVDKIMRSINDGTNCD